MLLFIVYVYIFVIIRSRLASMTSKHELYYTFPRWNDIMLWLETLWIACNLPTFRLPDFIIWLRKIYFSFTLNFCFHTEQTSLSLSFSLFLSLYRLLQRWKKNYYYLCCDRTCLNFLFFRKSATRERTFMTILPRILLFEICDTLLRTQFSRMPIAFNKATVFHYFLSMRTIFQILGHLSPFSFFFFSFAMNC